MTVDRIQLVRDCYRAFTTGDRALAEAVLSQDLVFSAPPDVGIDRTTYFERCWPNAHHLTGFDFARLTEVGDEVLVTYEATRTEGGRFRNTEIFGFDDHGISRVEVYFGWDLD
jgi:ketosteroid isomerase-like protein